MAKLGHQTLGCELDGIIIEVCSSLNWFKVEIFWVKKLNELIQLKNGL